MLAVPGALIALGLAYLAALGTVERDRRELALLRARGAPQARPRRPGRVRERARRACGRSARHRCCPARRSLGRHCRRSRRGAGSDHVRGLRCARLRRRAGRAGRSNPRSLPLERRRDPAERRREGRPLWQRLYLDVLALAVAGLVYWLTARTGFSAVVNPDSNPTLSLSVYMFLAPALLWIGATLLLVRLRGRAVAWLAAAPPAAGPRPGRLPARQRRPPRRRDQPGARRRRAAAGLRRRARSLHGDLRPAGTRRRAAHARRRRRRHPPPAPGSSGRSPAPPASRD